MAQKSLIEWTGSTWNPVRGCSRISPGCAKCYAMATAARFTKPGLAFHGFAVMTPNGPKWTGKVTLVEKLEVPLHWRKPRVIFVNSMSDLFHEDLPAADILRVFDMMNRANWHTYQILTKRSERLAELSPKIPWASHIWMGVSVENADYVHRIDDLRQSGARIKFLSIEPLLGPVPKLNLDGIDWVIVGGESGRNVRPMQADWARDIRDQCQAAGVSFFFKQFGKLINNPNRNDPTAKENGGTAKGGRELDGRTWDEMPGRIVCDLITGDEPKPVGSVCSLAVLS
jgi:protein gp37